MPAAPRLLRRACALLLLAAPLAAKPILPHGPHGTLLAGVLPLRVPSEIALEGSAAAAQFDTSPVPLPPNLASVNFEATGTAEFGDLVRLNGAGHFIGSVSVIMSTTALHSEHPGTTPFGFTHPITLSLYAVDRAEATPRPGQLLARVTESFLIPWRPEPDPNATALPGRPWRAANGQLFTGRAVTLTFDIGALGLALPDEVIFGVAFNTQHAGAQPLGLPGPYDGLALAVTNAPSGVGLDVNPDVVFWKTTHAYEYADGGATGSNTLRADNGWMPFRPAVRITDSNYGALYATLAQLDTVRSSDPAVRAALNLIRNDVLAALDRQLWEGNQRLDLVLGDEVFDFLADAAELLQGIVTRQDVHAAVAQQAIDELLESSATLADLAIVDAIIVGGNSRRIVLAQEAMDHAGEHEAHARLGNAIDRFGDAWREAGAAVR